MDGVGRRHVAAWPAEGVPNTMRLSTLRRAGGHDIVFVRTVNKDGAKSACARYVLLTMVMRIVLCVRCVGDGCRENLEVDCTLTMTTRGRVCPLFACVDAVVVLVI